MKLKTAHRRVVDPKLNRSIITSNDPRLIHTGNRKNTHRHTNNKQHQHQNNKTKQKPPQQTPQPHRSNPKQQKTAKNNKQQQKTTNSTLGTKTLQNLTLTINIANLPLNMLVPPRILFIPLQNLHPLAGKHIALFFPLKPNQISPPDLSQIPSQKPITQIRLIHNLRLLGHAASQRPEYPL
jgi:hypothetical protein